MNTTNTISSLMKRILNCLSECNIQNYSLYETTTKSEEAFFVKKDCTLTRNKMISECEVTIYHDFEISGINYRGSSGFVANPNMNEEELAAKLMSAYQSASYVKNLYFPLPSGDRMASSDLSSEISSEISPAHHHTNTSLYRCKDLAGFIYKNDIFPDAFINSLEIFVTETEIHIVNSNGVNVHFNDIIYSGEFIVQAKEPNDVELYQDFKYSYLDNDIASSLFSLVLNNLQAVRDRANAVAINHFNDTELSYQHIILQGNCVYELFMYYLRRLDASMIYPGYSHFKIGDSIISHQSLSDKINITLTPKLPYSSEGIQLFNLSLISDNTVNYITGDSRFSYYLGVPAIGSHQCYQLKNGNTSLNEIQTQPYLKIVNFSDFQMDELTGQFGGEFRLAYYYDGKNVIPVTNGSISGNINDVVSNMQLSSESQTSYYFNGPLAVSYPVKP